MRESNPRQLGVNQSRFHYANRPSWRRHEDSNLDYRLRRPASCPLDDGGKFWHPDQELNLDISGRSRVHYPLCYQGMAPPAGIEPALAG